MKKCSTNIVKKRNERGGEMNNYPKKNVNYRRDD